MEPQKLNQSIKKTVAKLNSLLHSAETMGVTVVVKPTNAISSGKEAITGTKSLMAITCPAKEN